jgi:tetratricopeptide (TPR) repeat protein
MLKNTLLQNARRQMGWTQQQLADFAELSLSTVERAERGEKIRMDSVRRLCICLQKKPVELGLSLTDRLDETQTLPSEQLHVVPYNDYLSVLEEEMRLRWSLYHTGGTQLVYQGLNAWVQQIAKCANHLQGSDLYERSLAVLSMGYQLQGSVFRDMMLFTEANIAHRKAFLIADKLFHPELIAAALGREGVTLNHQERPLEAIACFNRALETIKHLGYIKLEGYIYQGLSEAQAKAQQRQESNRSIGLAEKNFEFQSLSPENNFTQYNLSSLTAQKGVNSVLLHNYKEAINQIDTSLAQYNPTHMRGRARLLIQKAEAYYGLGTVDASVHYAQDAFLLANSIGSSKIISKVKDLHRKLLQSPWRKDQYVTDLGDILTGEK